MIQPLVWIVFFFVSSVISKNQVQKKKFAITGIVLLLFFSNQFIFNEVSRAWESQIPSYNQAEKTKFDVAIVLGGISNFDSTRQQYAFYGSAERLFNILPMYFDGTVEKILFAGGSGSLDQKNIEADIVEDYLLSIGVDSDDIILEKKSRNTYENVLYSMELLENKDREILLSTSATHMPRALRIFHKQGVFPTPSPVNYESYDNGRFTLDKLFVPNPKIMEKWYWLIHEWVGILSYKVMGYC